MAGIRGKDVHAPGFYLHLEPDNVFAGAGLWHPERATLDKVRGSLLAQPERWKRIVHTPAFRRRLALSGDSLVRPPRGTPRDHELAADLKRKDFVVVASFSEKDACSAGFFQAFAGVCRSAGDFMEFLTRSVGLRW